MQKPNRTSLINDEKLLHSLDHYSDVRLGFCMIKRGEKK